MQSLPQEFLVLCRQLGDVQKRCSATVAAQAAQIEALQAQVLRLRAQVVLRDTRLAMVQDEIVQLRQAHPGLPRRQAMARHITALAERIASLSRECLRWRLAAQADHSADARAAQTSDLAPELSRAPGGADALAAPSGAGRAPLHSNTETALDMDLAAADLVICQTGCIGHDDYWRVQDHCRRTGKACLLVDQSLAARQADVLVSWAPALAPRVAGGKDLEQKQGAALDG
ncbi:MAG: DUF2325 domain-containing protein [Acidovorax sp.]|uniref:DUF2325 domain-containing protein n=1 Tax=Acidovorax sp. TaxID=1872122 RepID=UPI0025BC5A63|nr:DUF2325 domain-containing protein [Acidovorax sp.]MCE1191603.1 DUF2325 domain-containing protein [Acidovorax sp.]